MHAKVKICNIIVTKYGSKHCNYSMIVVQFQGLPLIDSHLNPIQSQNYQYHPLSFCVYLMRQAKQCVLILTTHVLFPNIIEDIINLIEEYANQTL